MYECVCLCMYVCVCVCVYVCVCVEVHIQYPTCIECRCTNSNYPFCVDSVDQFGHY